MTVSPVRRSNRLIWLGRDVDVVGTVEVVPVLAAEEAVALGQDLQHALAADDGVRVEQRLLDAEDQVLLPEARVVGDVQLLGQRVQLRDRLLLQLSDIHGGDSRSGLARHRTGLTGKYVSARSSGVVLCM